MVLLIASINFVEQMIQIFFTESVKTEFFKWSMYAIVYTLQNAIHAGLE